MSGSLISLPANMNSNGMVKVDLAVFGENKEIIRQDHNAAALATAAVTSGGGGGTGGGGGAGAGAGGGASAAATGDVSDSMEIFNSPLYYSQNLDDYAKDLEEEEVFDTESQQQIDDLEREQLTTCPANNVEIQQILRRSSRAVKPSEEAKAIIERIKDIADKKEQIKFMRLQRIQKREQKAIEKIQNVLGKVQQLIPKSAIISNGSPIRSNIKRHGFAYHGLPAPNTVTRRLAAQQAELKDSLRQAACGVGDSSALNQLWPELKSSVQCCYLCGFPMHRSDGLFPDGNKTLKTLHGNPSPEHVIPMTAGGFAYIGVLQAGDNINHADNKNLKKLLRKELRPSHYWCNEVKANMLFITWITNNQININNTVIRDFLHLLYYGSAVPPRFYDEQFCKVYCKENNRVYPHLVYYFCKTRGLTFQQWFDESMKRITIIINDIITTINNLSQAQNFASQYGIITTRFENNGRPHWTLNHDVTTTEDKCHSGFIFDLNPANLPQDQRLSRSDQMSSKNAIEIIEAGSALGIDPNLIYSLLEERRQQEEEQQKMAADDGSGGGGGGAGGASRRRTRKHKPRKTRKRNRNRKTRKV